MPVKHIKSFDELISLINNERRVIVIKFSASWCAPCKLMAPIFKQCSESSMKDKIVFVEVDVDESPRIAEAFNVSSMPTFKALQNRKIVNEFSGASKENLYKMLSAYF